MKFKNMVFGCISLCFVMLAPVAKGGLSSPANSVKVIFLGDSGVGKTSLILRMLYWGGYLFESPPTVGADYHTLSGDNIQLIIWDTAGQERFRALVPLYVANTEIAVIVFSVDDSGSFEAIESWLEVLMSRVSVKSYNVKVILVANKTDLEMTVTEEKIRQKAKNSGAEWLYCSAKTGDGVSELKGKMLNIARGILNSREEAERLLRVETREREKCC